MALVALSAVAATIAAARYEPAVIAGSFKWKNKQRAPAGSHCDQLRRRAGSTFVGKANFATCASGSGLPKKVVRKSFEVLLLEF